MTLGSREARSAAQGRKSSETAWGTDENGVVGEGWPDGSGVLAGASDEEAGPAGNEGRASDPTAATNEIEKRTTRVGICFADYETFWWAADRPEQSACPACSTEDEDYAANHRFYVSEETT